ncbi:MAG: PilZ domain-containing protein [Treponema sp.]|nr:PilZ domain-containing protein [Treponema sp.]
MGVTTSHHIQHYYDYFRDKEIVFTKANLKALKIDPRQIYLKCNGGQWPCIINSTSLQQVRVFVGTGSGIYQAINKNRSVPISVRYSFFANNGEPIQFFVNSTVAEVKPYPASNELAIVTLSFTQRPPDELILRLGEFIEVNENFKNRKEERISLNENSLRQLGIPKEESYIFIEGVPRKCVMKDLSFGGARVMLVGIPKFLENKSVDLRMFFTDTNEKLSLPGVIKEAEFLEGRKDVSTVHIEFSADDIPMSYKFHINSYITSYQKKLIEKQMSNQIAQEKAAAEAAAKKAEISAEMKKRAEEKQAAETAQQTQAKSAPAAQPEQPKENS